MNFNKVAVETHFLLDVRDSTEARIIMTTSTRGNAPVRRHALLTLEQPSRKKTLAWKVDSLVSGKAHMLFPVLWFCSGVDAISLPYLDTY